MTGKAAPMIRRPKTVLARQCPALCGPELRLLYEPVKGLCAGLDLGDLDRGP